MLIKMVKKIIFEQSSEGNVEILTDIYGKRIPGQRNIEYKKPATAYLAPSWIWSYNAASEDYCKILSEI